MGHWPEAETRSFELFILTAPILNAVTNEYYRKYAIDTAQRENLTIIKKLTAETGNWYVKFCDNGAVFHVNQKRCYQKTVRKSYCNTKAQEINFYQEFAQTRLQWQKENLKHSKPSFK